MNDTNKHTAVHWVRQSVVVTLILLLLCGVGFPVVLGGLSAVIFPSQAKGSLVMADGEAVGAANVGQDFTEPYFMKCRPSACHYNTYYEDEEGNQFYHDGSEFAGLASGNQNYAPSNPALTERVEADIEEFLAANPGVSREEIPADLMTASASGLSEEELSQIVADNTTGKLLGVFGEETVNVLGVNLDIAKAMGLVSQTTK